MKTFMKIILILVFVVALIAISPEALLVGNLGGSFVQAGTGCKYVIVTNESLKPTFERLAAWKSSRPIDSITAMVITVEQIYSQYSGRDNQEKIRNFIKNAHDLYGTQYVLLGGDVSVIPCRYMYGAHETITYDVPADIYYGCLDGDWDFNGNGKFGEPGDGLGGGEVDLFAEVYIGRAPVETVNEATNFVNKTIAHEQATDPDIASKALLVSDNMMYGSLDTDYIAESMAGFQVDKFYVRDGSFNKKTLISKLNSGVGVISHWSHADYYKSLALDKNDVASLSNSVYFFVLSGACFSAGFDQPTTSGGLDAIGEYFVTSAHGAFAYVGNSRTAYGSGKDVRREFFIKISEGHPHLGEALQLAKETTLSGKINGTIGIFDPARVNYYTANLLGDPETSLVCDFDMPRALIISPSANNPIKKETIAVTGIAGKGRLSSATFSNYRLEYGAGYEPTAWSSEGITLSGNGAVEVDKGELGNWDTSNLEIGLYTLKLTVIDQSGATNESYQRISIIAPWLLITGEIMSSNLTNSIELADIDTDGKQEIFYGNYNNMDIYRCDGSAFRPWSAEFYNYKGGLSHGASIGDIKNDGFLEFAQTGYGNIYLFDSKTMSTVDGDNDGKKDWPKIMAKASNWNQFNTPVVLADIDGDGKLEILAVYKDDISALSKIYAWRIDGTTVTGWPVALTGADTSVLALAACDINNDGKSEIVVSGNAGSVYVFKGAGDPMPNWPIALSGAPKVRVVIGDINGDRQKEIVGVAGKNVYVWGLSGQVLPSFPVAIPDTSSEFGLAVGDPILADLDNDGIPEIITGETNMKGSAYCAHIYAIDHFGRVHTIRTVGDKINPTPIAGDIDGDGAIELISASTGYVYAIRSDGSDLPDWPKKISLADPQFLNASIPALGDIDSDGRCELVLSANCLIYVIKLSVEYSPDLWKMPWPMCDRDLGHTKSYPDYMHTLSGEVTDGSIGIDGVTIKAGKYSAQTSNGGRFNIDIPSGVYSVTPEKIGFAFSPSSGEVILRGDACISFEARALLSPDAPIIGTATAGNAQATVSFTAPASDGGSPITSYTVTSNPGGVTATGVVSPIVVTGLVNGTSYTFTVKATNAVGTGSASAASNRVMPVTLPAAPTLSWVTAASNAPSIYLGWSPVSYAAGYKVYRSTSSAGTYTEIKNTTSAGYTDGGLAELATYYYKVKAYNAAGSSADSVVKYARTWLNPPKTLTAAAAAGKKIVLSWTKDSAKTTGYRVYRQNTDNTWALIATITSSNTTSFTNTGLAASTAYKYRVCAYNGSDVSVNSNTATATTTAS